MAKSTRNRLCTGLDDELCEACIYGKQHRLSFGSREQHAATISNQTDEYEDTENSEETTSDNQELGGHGLRDRSKILKPQRYR